MCGPIIELIGLSLGLLLWGSLNMLTGWATGSFGLFGLDADGIVTPTLNFIGIAFAIVGLLIYLQVKTSNDGDSSSNSSNGSGRVNSTLSKMNISNGFFSKSSTTQGTSDHHVSLLYPEDVESVSSLSQNSSFPSFGTRSKIEKSSDVPVTTQGSFGSDWGANKKRFVGIMMSCVAGVLFGCSFVPSQYVIDHRYGGNDDTLNYVFPHFCGIILSSWVYMFGYCLYCYFKHTPIYVNPDCILPATISGILWGVAEIAWFVANKRLGFSVSFPIITSGPGFIGAMWGIFHFKEITGKRNLLTLAAAFCITLPGLVLIACSRDPV